MPDDETRKLDTDRAPPMPEDSIPPTNRGGEQAPPTFAGSSPPLQLPAAPEWTGKLFQAIEGVRTDLRTMKQSLDLLHGQFDSFSWEFRARAHNMEGLLLKHQTAIGELQGDFALLDRRLSVLETDGK